MDKSEQQNLTRFATSQFLKKITKLVLSVFVFSFFISYSSSYSIKFLQFFSFSSQFLIQAMNKNCIFLICNGILVFLANTSGFRFLPENDLSDQLLKKIEDEDSPQISFSFAMDSFPEKDVTLLEAPKSQDHNIAVLLEEEDDDDDKYLNEKESARESSDLIQADGDQEIESGYFITEEEDGRVDDKEEETKEELETSARGFSMEEDIGLLSTEELNKKFDEFIRRMREEIRIGAQQQLVMAYV